MFSPTLLPDIPKLKLRRMQEPLHLGDSMRITGLHENGFLAQLNGSIEVLLVPGYDRNASSEEDEDESPPLSHRSLPPPSRKSPPPPPSRSHSQPSPSRTSFEVTIGDIRLSPRGASSPCLPIATLCPRNRAKTMLTKDPATSNSVSSPASPRSRSSTTSPRSSPTLPPAPTITSLSRSPPRLRSVAKPVQVATFHIYYVHPRPLILFILRLHSSPCMGLTQ